MSRPDPFDPPRDDALAALLDGNAAAFCALDRAWRYVFVNAEAERLAGRPRAELLGRVVWELFPELVDSVAWRELHRAARDGVTVQCRFHHPPRNVWLDVRACPSPDGIFIVSHDATAQIDAELRAAAERVEAEQRYRGIFDQTAVGICETKDGRQFTSANDPFCAMLGYTREELLRLSPEEVTHPDEREVTRRNLAALRAGETDGFTLEKRYVRKDGGVVWAQTAVSAVRDATGRIARVLAIVQDISARRLAEEERRASEHRLRQALEAGNCGIYEWDILADRVSWTERVYKFFGMTPGEPVGGVADFASRLHPDDRDRVQASVRNCLESDTPHRMEYRVIRPDGQVRWLFTHSAVTRDPSGTPVRMLGACIDVTDRRQSEAALRERDARLQLIVDAAPALISYIDVDCRYQLANRAYQDWFGHDPEAIKGRHVREVLGDAAWELVRPHMERALGGENVTFEQEVPYRAAGPRWVHVTYTPDRDASGVVRGFVVLVHDVEAAKRGEAALKQAKAEAEHASRAKDQFLAVLSHELRTPLTPVVMTVAAMEMDRSLTPQMREDLAMIRRNIELETRLIDDLLDVTRITNGKLRLNPRPSDVHALTRHVLEILKTDIMEKRLDVRVELDAADPSVTADPARLQQVFWNLVKNAVKFTPDRGRVAVRTWNPSEFAVCLEVSDDGAGIDPEVLPRLFNAFDQGEQTVTRQFGGLGLGLAISKALTELHGGTIRAESGGKGCGARFIVELPTRTPVERIVDKLQPIGSRDGDDARPKVRLLLVEDHVDTQRQLRRLLEDLGYAVHVAGSVAAARAILAHHPIDLLISDIGLPDATGLDLMRYARQVHGLAGIAISGFGTDTDVRASDDAGFEAHLTKPVELAQLDALIRVLASPQVAPGTAKPLIPGPSQVS